MSNRSFIASALLFSFVVCNFACKSAPPPPPPVDHREIVLDVLMDVEKDASILTRRFEKACIDGDEQACRTMAEKLLLSPTVDGRNRAQTILRRQCKAGLAESCVIAKIDPERYLTALCSRGNGGACAQLSDKIIADALMNARGPISRDAFRRGFELAVRACELGHRKHCSWALRQLVSGKSQMAPDGEQLRNHKRAASLARKACEGGDPSSCSWLIEIYDAGEVPVDAVFRAHASKVACRTGYSNGCRAPVRKTPKTYDQRAP